MSYLPLMYQLKTRHKTMIDNSIFSAILYLLGRLSKDRNKKMKCKQCGDDSDLLVAFTKHQICGRCTKQNHKKAVK
jgi:ribosomal protein S27AE